MKNESKNQPINTENHRQLRKGLREKGFNVYTFIGTAYFMAYLLSRWNMRVYWVFAEPHGFMVLDWDDSQKINKGRMKNNIPKLRENDLNKIAIFRTPKKSWGIIKNNSKR